MSNFEVTDDDITEIVTLTLQLTKATCVELRKHHLPVTREISTIISESIAASLIGKMFGHEPSNHLH